MAIYLKREQHIENGQHDDHLQEHLRPPEHVRVPIVVEAGGRLDGGGAGGAGDLLEREAVQEEPGLARDHRLPWAAGRAGLPPATSCSSCLVVWVTSPPASAIAPSWALSSSSALSRSSRSAATLPYHGILHTKPSSSATTPKKTRRRTVPRGTSRPGSTPSGLLRATSTADRRRCRWHGGLWSLPVRENVLLLEAVRSKGQNLLLLASCFLTTTTGGE
jgi:hypothetical protein